MNYKGVIIEESLEDKSVLHNVKVVKTDVEQVTERHKTPWLSQWTLHTVEIPEKNIEEVVAAVSHLFDKKHNSWYADFKNDEYHFIVYPHKIFMIPLGDEKEYEEARAYGISWGIPEYQVNLR